MILTIGQLIAYTLVQTFGISIFTLSLNRLGKLASVYRWEAFGFLLLVNFAGALTFGADSWLRTSKPIAAGLFLLGIPFMLGSHAWLVYKRLKNKQN